MNSRGIAARRDRLRELGAAVGKVLLALTVFMAIFLGWQYFQARQLQAFQDSLPLPDHVVSNECALWFVGSSSFSRWDTLQNDMAPWSTHNRAVGGSTLKEITHRFRNDQRPDHPRAIIFYAGENDLAFDVPPDQVAARFAEFMQEKTARMGQVPVFFLSVKPSRMRWDERAEQAASNRAVFDLSRRRSDLRYVDTTAPFMVDGHPGPFFDDDGLHPNAAGYRIFARLILPALARDLPRDMVRRCVHGST